MDLQTYRLSDMPPSVVLVSLKPSEVHRGDSEIGVIQEATDFLNALPSIPPELCR